MTQDKEKLKEVGLEPDKPKGHIRAIWALTLILAFAIVIAGGIYFILWYSPWGENVPVNKSQTTPTPSPTATLSGSPTASPSSSLKTYQDQYLTFNYPSDWKVESVPLFGGGIYVNLDLGITDQTESSLGYSSAPYSGVIDGLQKDKDLVFLNDVVVSGVSGKKAIRQGSNYYSYDIVVPITAGASTFSVHYTTAFNAKNKDEVAAKLDELIKTINLLTK